MHRPQPTPGSHTRLRMPATFAMLAFAIAPVLSPIFAQQEPTLSPVTPPPPATVPSVTPPPTAQTPAPELRSRPKPTTPRLPHLPARGFTEPDEPTNPEPATAQIFTDPKYKVSFTVPAGWNFEKKDGLLSNFGVDTRTARRRTDVRGVAAINFNPWPVSTFASAIFYYSVLSRATAATCVAQASTKPVKPLPDTTIDGTSFHHGHDKHGVVCTEARDDVFTAMQSNACLRFDLVVNTFCAETSGAMEITATQLNDVDGRLAALLGSVTLAGGTHGDRPAPKNPDRPSR